MNALTHTTSRVFPSRQSDRYTPRLHGRPSTVLIGACESEHVVSGRTSTSKLFPSHSLSPLGLVLKLAGLTLVRTSLFAFPPTTTIRSLAMRGHMREVSHVFGTHRFIIVADWACCSAPTSFFHAICSLNMLGAEWNWSS